MLREIKLHKEHQNLALNPSNKIHALNLPSNVKAYITLEKEYDLENAYPVKNNSILRYKKNNVFLPPKTMYLHTVGTSDETLELQLDVVNYNNNSYMEIEQQDNQTMNLNDDVTGAILSKEINGFSTPLLQELDKIINPFTAHSVLQGQTHATSVTNLLHLTSCDFDKAEVYIGIGDSNSSGEGLGNIYVEVNNVRVLSSGAATSVSAQNESIPLENLKGKDLKIYGCSQSAQYTTHYYVQTYLKKV